MKKELALAEKEDDTKLRQIVQRFEREYENAKAKQEIAETNVKALTRHLEVTENHFPIEARKKIEEQQFMIENLKSRLEEIEVQNKGFECRAAETYAETFVDSMQVTDAFSQFGITACNPRLSSAE